MMDYEPLQPDALDRLVNETVAGKYGMGAERVERLGIYYTEVQSEINRRLNMQTPRKNNDTSCLVTCLVIWLVGSGILAVLFFVAIGLGSI